MKSLSRAVIAAFTICIAYTITAVVLAVKGIYLPDTLTQYFFITFGVEFASTAAIKIAKSVVRKDEINEKIDKLKENNLHIDKSDFKTNSNDYDYDDGGIYG